MILRGISQLQLTQCLSNCQDTYDNNLKFNRFEPVGHKMNTKGIRAVDMSGAVIITKKDGKGIVLRINDNDDWHTDYQNPFLPHQHYRIRIDVPDRYYVMISVDNCAIREKLFKTPELVVDYLRNNEDVNAIAFTLGVHDSKKAGAHRSARGRRTVSACWHVHRDVMKKIFKMNEHANLRTTMAHYKDKESFYKLYPNTAYMMAGSIMHPAHVSDLCEC